MFLPPPTRSQYSILVRARAGVRVQARGRVWTRLTVGVGVDQNSIAFGKAPPREADSQPINQAGRQAGRQAETHSLAFFQSWTTSTNSGEPQLHQCGRQSSGRTLAFRHRCCGFKSRLVIAGAGRSTHYSFSPNRGSNPSQHKPQNQKIHWGIVLSSKILILQGVRHPISCLLVYYVNDPPKRGCTGPRLRLI